MRRIFTAACVAVLCAACTDGGAVAIDAPTTTTTAGPPASLAVAEAFLDDLYVALDMPDTPVMNEAAIDLARSTCRMIDEVGDIAGYYQPGIGLAVVVDRMTSDGLDPVVPATVLHLGVEHYCPDDLDTVDAWLAGAGLEPAP